MGETMTNFDFWQRMYVRRLGKMGKNYLCGNERKAQRYKALIRRANKKKLFMTFAELQAEHKTQR